MKKYKYLIINIKTDESTIKKSVRCIEEFIKKEYPEKGTSHSTISRRINESNGYFYYYDLIIKKLIW